MNKFAEVKSLLENREVAKRYLGTPSKSSFKGDWYLSPFRTEKTASLYVSDKGIHDFGSSKHYDIIDFVAEYYNVTPIDALTILCKDFGIEFKRNIIDNKSLKALIEEREKKKKLKEDSIKFHNQELIKVCKKIQENRKLIEIFKHSFNFEVLEILYNNEVVFDYDFEELVKMNSENKIRRYLWKNKK